MSSKKLTPPKTEDMSHGDAQRAAAEYCRNAHLPEYRFSSESMSGVLLYNLGHPDNSRMLSTDKKIHCATGIPNIWVAANQGSAKRKVA
jgi:hypothetical protein